MSFKMFWHCFSRENNNHAANLLSQPAQILRRLSLATTFFYENVATGLRRMVSDRVEEVHALNTYSVENVPAMVAVSLKRFDEQLMKIESEVQQPTPRRLFALRQ